MNKLVAESLERVFKPKSEEDYWISINQRLEEIYEMDVDKQIDAIAEWLDVNINEAAEFILSNVEKEKRNKAIKDTFMIYAKQWFEDFKEEKIKP